MTGQLDDADPATDAAPVMETTAADAAAQAGSEPADDAEDATEATTAAAAPEAEPPPVDGADASLLSLIDRLSTLLERSDLTELEVQVGSTGLVLRKPQAIAPPVLVAGGQQGGSATDGAATGASAATSAAGAVADGPPARPAVMAPLSGIWYGSPAPGTAPYVSVGGEVAVGQVIGLIEAMKLFNEIKSDKAGRVVKLNAENGKLVRAKQPLIEVEPL